MVLMSKISLVNPYHPILVTSLSEHQMKIFLFKFIAFPIKFFFPNKQDTNPIKFKRSLK